MTKSETQAAAKQPGSLAIPTASIVPQASDDLAAQLRARREAAAGLVPVDPRDEIADHVDGSFVLVVRLSGGRYRRRCFLTAAAAERAARRAINDGHKATVFLAELKPLWKLTGGAS